MDSTLVKYQPPIGLARLQNSLTLPRPHSTFIYLLGHFLALVYFIPS